MKRMGFGKGGVLWENMKEPRHEKSLPPESETGLGYAQLNADQRIRYRQVSSRPVSYTHLTLPTMAVV